MSKASAWANKGRRQMRFRERLTAFQRARHLQGLVCVVGRNGDLVLSEIDEPTEDRLSPKEAVRFARWILDTFGES